MKQSAFLASLDTLQLRWGSVQGPNELPLAKPANFYEADCVCFLKEPVKDPLPHCEGPTRDHPVPHVLQTVQNVHLVTAADVITFKL